MLSINVSTQVFGDINSQASIPDVTLRLVSQQLTAKEIIANAVKEQLKHLLKEQVEYQSIRSRLNTSYLNEQQIQQMAETGKVALASEDKKEISLEQEISRVLTAFKNHRFKMFIDGNEIRTLEDLCIITEGSKVKFIRLIPLAGG